MAAVSTGTTCLFGVINGTISNAFVQSFSVSATFNLSGTVADETGLTKTARYDDRKTEITVDVICKTSSMPVIGTTLTFTTNTASAYPSGSASTSYVGTITSILEKSSNKDFTACTITAVDYEGVTP